MGWGMRSPSPFAIGDDICLDVSFVLSNRKGKGQLTGSLVYSLNDSLTRHGFFSPKCWFVTWGTLLVDGERMMVSSLVWQDGTSF